MADILGFFGEYRWLSNFWVAKQVVDGVSYFTNEHYYQYQKTKDPQIFNCVLASDAKRIGKTSPIVVPDWNGVRLSVMREGLHAKFSQNEGLKQKLLDTGNAYIEETNSWGDQYWGVCRGTGSNHLGRLLMGLRDEFRMERFYV